jgi:hypothetical protein
MTEIGAVGISSIFHGTSSSKNLQNSVVATSSSNRTNQQISLRKMQTNLNNKRTPRGKHLDDLEQIT